MVRTNNILTVIRTIVFGMFLHRSKKGMLGNLVGGFIVILIGSSLIGPIAQELNNAMSCNYILNNSMQINGVPEGSTNSFGGGGSNHFGGYDGQVQHKTFLQDVAGTSLYKTNSSFLNPDCIDLTGTVRGSVLQMVSLFFALGLLGVGIAVAYSGLRNAGVI